MDAISRKIGSVTPFSVLTRTTGYADQYPNFPCDADTVALASRMYADDARLYGYTFDDAMKACTEMGVSSRRVRRGAGNEALFD